MRDELLLYYERELNYLRQLGAEFAEKYPKIAGRLVLEPKKNATIRTSSGCWRASAFLAARVHLKIDDEFPEITEALLSILYPHYIRPHALHVDRRNASRRRPGRRGLPAKSTARLRAEFETRRRRALPVPNLF